MTEGQGLAPPACQVPIAARSALTPCHTTVALFCAGWGPSNTSEDCKYLQQLLLEAASSGVGRHFRDVYRLLLCTFAAVQRPRVVEKAALAAQDFLA